MMRIYGNILLAVMALAMGTEAVSAQASLAENGVHPPAQESAAWTGHYYLQGVMETGSELLLQADGHFQWYLVVGALDLFAEGRWEAKDGNVVLTAVPSKDVPQPAFETMTLRQEDGRLLPGEPLGRGAYVRPERGGD
jgi:hypothetical protein